MSLRQSKQMSLDTESSAHIGMEAQSRSSKFLLLQVWCGVLTVAIVVMATLLAPIKLKPTEADVSTVKPDNVSPTAITGVMSRVSQGSSLSYIQLTPLDRVSGSWEAEISCDSCSLNLCNNSIYCTKEGDYFIYAQVTFSLGTKEQDSKPLSVVLERHSSTDLKGRETKALVEGTFPKNISADRASLWVGKIVRLKETDSIRIIVKGDFITTDTFWGAYQLH